MNNSLDKIREIIGKFDCDGVIINNNSDIRYLSGLKSSNISILVTSDKAFVLSDGRYKYMIERQELFTPVCITKGMCESLIELITEQKLTKVMIDPSDISHKNYKNIAEQINLYDYENILSELRIIKRDEEISNIIEAQRIADRAFTDILDEISIGMTTKEIAALLDYKMAVYGSEEPAFSTITVNEEESADCHGVPSEKKIKSGDLILFDFGATYNGYRSDITRTIAVESICNEKKDIYDLVLKAHTEAVMKVKPGVLCSDIDEAARKCFRERNLEEYFIHSLGHGVGLDIHEAPVLSKKSETVLKKGMIITIEPGLYFKDKYGIRIEDTYLVTENGCKSLTNIQKNLIII